MALPIEPLYFTSGEVIFLIHVLQHVMNPMNWKLKMSLFVILYVLSIRLSVKRCLYASKEFDSYFNSMNNANFLNDFNIVLVVRVRQAAV